MNFIIAVFRVLSTNEYFIIKNPPAFEKVYLTHEQVSGRAGDSIL
jgi:hypothetical protein